MEAQDNPGAGRDWARGAVLGIVFLMPAAMALSTFTMPFRPTLLRGLGIPLLAMEALIVLATLAAGPRVAPLLRDLPRTATIAIGAMLALSVVNAFAVAPDPFMAKWLTGALVIHGLAAVSFAAWAVARPAFGLDLIKAMTGGLLAFIAVVVALTIFAVSRGQFNGREVGFGVSNVRHFAYFGVVGLMLSLALARISAESVWRCGWLAAATANLAFIMWTGSRGGLFAFAAAAAAQVAISAWRGDLPKFWGHCVLIVLPAAVLSMAWVPPDPHWGLKRVSAESGIASNGPSDVTSGRTGLWRDAVDIVSRRPLTGYGQGQFRSLSPSAGANFSHPHNFILQFLVDGGAVYLVAALTLIGLALGAGGRAARRADSVAGAAFSAAFAILALGLIDGSLFHFYPVFAFVTLLALASARACGLPLAALSSARAPVAQQDRAQDS